MSPETTKPPPAKPAPKTAAAPRPQEPALKCPRCDSPNTKFCYYNNYSLTQPRHFCKTCRRYWTRGGALRNVPIGGGCRKNKKIKSSPRLSGDASDSDNSGGLRFFQGISPAMDFQLINNFATRLQYPAAPNNAAVLFNQLSSFGDVSNPISSSPCFNLDPPPPPPPPAAAGTSSSSSPLMGFNFTNNPGFQEPGSSNFQSGLAHSIESLSSMNQDLHWKLQQQRLAMMFVGDNHEKGSEKPQPILFQNLDCSSSKAAAEEEEMMNQRKDGGGNLSTEWFFDNSYATDHVTPTPASSSSNVNENSGNWTGIQAWADINQYSSLP